MARLVELRVRGLRTLADVTLSLSGLTVLIGDNGTGKSSLLEALRIAQLVAGSKFMETLSREHMLGSAVRADAGELKLDLRVEADGHNLAYSISLNPAALYISHEAIHELPAGLGLSCGAASSSDARPLIVRYPEKFSVTDGGREQPTSPLLSIFEYFGRAPDVESVAIIREALEGIDIHLPFEVSATWAARAFGRAAGARDAQMIQPSDRLELFGANLANVYQTLKNSGSERWHETMELLGLGLGPDLKDVLLTAVAGGGHLSLGLELRGRGHVPAFQLADGQLTYLAFVALVQLERGRTLLTFDEPEQHLHPALLNRVLQLFEDASTRYPVILATHSDRLLDFLPDPAATVRVCELDAQHRTHLRKLDAAQLDAWMQRYSGLGEIRAAGQLRSIVSADEDAA
ncbi:AAA family ATPase [Enhygromyxa salina]|uniref:AAA family ATPase n=1 Tax=Enhygromyxa salina TaxID=215803 RepID=UPI0015E693FC|nr:AAA family ATPase [Enhygromyxa salina]